MTASLGVGLIGAGWIGAVTARGGAA